MSAARCVKLLLVLTLVPLALRAASLLLGGHAVPASSHHRQSPIRRGSSSDAIATATGRVSVSASSVPSRPYRQTRHRRRAQGTLAAFDGTRRRAQGTLAALDGTRRLRQAEGWFEDDKRLAPTGSNPLHNLR